MTIPPPEKSGPGSTAISSSVRTLRRELMTRSMASATSPGLCEHIVVAIPTAMPVTPLMIRLGSAAGITDGSSPSPS